MKLHFTIRDLFWLTLVAAVLLAWWADHRSMQSQLFRLEVILSGNSRF
jgi:hypothetical protein